MFTHPQPLTKDIFQNFDVFLEAQIENTATVPMSLEKVDLEPSPHYNVTPILPGFVLVPFGVLIDLFVGLLNSI